MRYSGSSTKSLKQFLLLKVKWLLHVFRPNKSMSDAEKN